MMWNPSVNAIWLRAASSVDASVNIARIPPGLHHAPPTSWLLTAD